MREQKRIAVADIEPDPDQPRKHFDEADLLALGQNLKAIGQQLPVIVHEVVAADAGVKRWRLVEGERRWRGAQLVGIAELDAIVLPAKPSAKELLVLQASIDVHRASLSAMERSNLLARIQKETGGTVTEVAGLTNMSQPQASKLLSFQRLTIELQQSVHAGTLDTEKAAIIASQTTDPARQKALMADAGKLSRDQLRQKAKANDKPEVKAATVSLALPGSMVVNVKGPDMTMDTLCQVLQEGMKQVRKAAANGHDVTSVQRYLRDQVKAVRS